MHCLEYFCFLFFFFDFFIKKLFIDSATFVEKQMKKIQGHTKKQAHKKGLLKKGFQLSKTLPRK